MENRRVNVRGIIYRESKILAVRHKSNHASNGEADYWAVPGGGVDPLESIDHAIVRELVEETGVTPTVGRLLFIQQFPSEREGREEELELFYLIENPDDYLEIDIESTTHGAIELTRFDFIDAKQETILPAFLSSIDIADYCENIRPVFVYNQL